MVARTRLNIMSLVDSLPFFHCGSLWLSFESRQLRNIMYDSTNGRPFFCEWNRDILLSTFQQTATLLITSAYFSAFAGSQNTLATSCLSNLHFVFLTISFNRLWIFEIKLYDEHRQRASENRVLRRIFRPKRDGLTGEWRKLHNEELNDLYSSPNIVRVIKS